MADQENQNTEVQEAENNEESLAYWCYHCNKEVSLEPHEEDSQMVCSECRDGFVEAMATAQRAHHDRLVNNGRPRRQRHPRVERVADSSYHRQVLRVLRLFTRAAQANPRRDGALGEAGSRAGNQNEGRLSSVDREHGDDGSDSGDNQLDSGSRQTVTEHDQLNPGHPQAADAPDTDNNLLIDANEFLDDEEEDADGENVLNIELDPWDSFEEEDDDDDDEDEEEEENDAWEEVDEGDATEDQGEQRGNEEPDLNSEENTGASNEAGERRPTSRRRDVLRLRIRDWNSQSGGAVLETSRGSLDWHEIMQGLEDNTIELRVSLPEEDTYVGNPEDYVDEAGYEILLQNLAENDDTHRGAPPAAKSVIEGLPSVVICQDEIESGAALCAICKDVIPLGQSGKKLPCQHLYHGDCLIPWLNSRNSCPICRYELPTDDADYEDQKKQRSMVRSTPTNPPMNSPEGGLS